MKEYQIIREYYGDKRAERSRVPYIVHIDEAMKILDSIGASEYTKRAYCIHPMLQSNEGLVENIGIVKELDPMVVALVMEYRKTAMGYLSRRKITSLDEIELSPLYEVNQMIYADKVQNKKDFLQYHHGKHPKSEELLEYFNNWLEKLRFITPNS